MQSKLAGPRALPRLSASRRSLCSAFRSPALRPGYLSSAATRHPRHTPRRADGRARHQDTRSREGRPESRARRCTPAPRAWGWRGAGLCGTGRGGWGRSGHRGPGRGLLMRAGKLQSWGTSAAAEGAGLGQKTSAAV